MGRCWSTVIILIYSVSLQLLMESISLCKQNDVFKSLFVLG